MNILQSLLRQRQIYCYGLDLLPAPTRAIFHRSHHINTGMKDSNISCELSLFYEVCSTELDYDD